MHKKIKSPKLLLLRFKHVCEKHTEKKETKGQYYDQKKLRVVKNKHKSFLEIGK